MERKVLVYLENDRAKDYQTKAFERELPQNEKVWHDHCSDAVTAHTLRGTQTNLEILEHDFTTGSLINDDSGNKVCWPQLLKTYSSWS